MTPTGSIRLKLETIRANFTLVGGAPKAIGTAACAGVPIDVLVTGAGETNCVTKGEVIWACLAFVSTQTSLTGLKAASTLV